MPDDTDSSTPTSPTVGPSPTGDPAGAMVRPAAPAVPTSTTAGPTAGGAAAADDVLHITTPGTWEEGRRRGEVRSDSLASEGFVHCSTRAQLAGTLARHFAGSGPLVGLVLDAERVGDLRWEESRPGEVFPHVYNAIPLAAVLATEPLAPVPPE